MQVTFTGAQDTSAAQPERALPKSQRHPGPWQPSVQGGTAPSGLTAKEDVGVPGSVSLRHSNPHHRQCRRHSTLHAYAWCPSSTQTQMTIVKNSVYFSLKSELSFKKQVISLVRGCGAELQGKGLHHALLQAKSCCSLRVYTACIRQAQSTQGGLHGLAVSRARSTGPPPQLGAAAVRGGSCRQHRTRSRCCSLCTPWQQCQQPPCQQGGARAAAGTGWPRCRHRVNPEWLVHCCRDLA